MMTLPGAKEIKRLAERSIPCSLIGPHRPQQWKVLTATAVGDPLKKVYVFAILECGTCRVKEGVVITCRNGKYQIRKVSKDA